MIGRARNVGILVALALAAAILWTRARPGGDPLPDAVSSRAATPDVAAGAPAPRANDHAVYSAVLREHFMQPRRGEHALLCEPEEPGRRVAIVTTTQPLPPGTPARDSGWAAELPTPTSPLMAALRALDSDTGRMIVSDSLSVGVPIDLLPDSVARRTLRNSEQSAPPLLWFSRVAYTAGGTWALVYAVQVCPGTTEAKMADAENGAYERVLLAPLEWRDRAWTVHSPVFLDVGLPRLAPP